MADQSMRDYGLAAPHGPNMTGQHVATAEANFANMNPNEAGVFRQLLLPDDSYDADGTYWADMKLARRFQFVSKVDNAESARELRGIGAMIKADPLSPIGWYMRNAVIPGMGLLLEGYVLFSVGNVKPLLALAFPACWGSFHVCNKTWTQSLDYLEILGIIIGQILVGVIGDWLGRRWGLIQDAAIMFVGLLMLTAAWGTTLNGWVICYAWSLFVYGIGVGGEYPMTATSGMENAVGAGKISTREDRLHRGRKVVSAFLMQGWGQLFNQVILILALLAFNGKGGPNYYVPQNPPLYRRFVVQWVYRVSFAIPAIGTLWLVYYRIYKMRSASRQLQIAKQKQHVTGYDVASLKLTFKHFGGRLFATAGGWYANDIFFYGNKLFSGSFIQTIVGGQAAKNDIMITWLYNLINIGCELAGYYLASFLVDNKFYGRKWMQIIGFTADYILFMIPAFSYQYYSTKGTHTFQAMYYLSTFFNQFGPNCTTFLVAAEVFPTPVRASAHGFSAAWGKLGALTAAVAFNYCDKQTQFYVVPWFGLGGALITLIFLPDTTGLDLKEQERRWAYIRAGREHEYHGVAIHPRHLSWWEMLFGIHKQYNAELDYQQRVEEMRADWEASMARRVDEKDNKEDNDMDDDWSAEVSTFFERTRTHNGNGNANGNGSYRDEKLAEGYSPSSSETNGNQQYTTTSSTQHPATTNNTTYTYSTGAEGDDVPIYRE